MRITVVAGARPNFMKVAPLVDALRRARVETRLVHTGQHYDRMMSQTFFDELNIPQPDANLEVGSGSPVWQIAEVMRRFADELTSNRPDAVVVVGDVNSTLATGLAAVKMDIPLAHVEAGLRSGDRTMPEETNRVVVDSISHWLFTSEPAAAENLRREGIDESRIHFAGNVMIDTLLAHRERALCERTHLRHGLQASCYAVLTLHRPSNVDDAERLDSILAAIDKLRGELPIVFVVHPRTRSRLERFGLEHRLKSSGITAIEPQGYLAMLGLMQTARMVLTDSGGIQEEASVLGVPCLTLRENTERPSTIEAGGNVLVGWRTDDILRAANDELQTPGRNWQPPERWDGRAAGRITEILLREAAVCRAA